MHFSSVFLATLFAVPLSYAQQVPDGLIVPFTSRLPACASKCGPLFDVQGGCTPPNINSIDQNCFCTDGRLSAFNGQGTAGVSSVCGPASCTGAAELETIKSWYQGLCGSQAAAPTATRTGAPTGSSTSKSTSAPNSGNNGGFDRLDEDDNRPWIQSHWKWLVMIAVIIIAIVGIWVGSWLLRKRYLRKKEKEFEMGSPLGWVPNRGDGHGDGAADERGIQTAGGHHKESGGARASNGSKLKKQEMGWFRSAKI